MAGISIATLVTWVCSAFRWTASWLGRTKWRHIRLGLIGGRPPRPFYFEGRLYFVNDNEETSYLMALDAATGEPIWRVDRDEKSNWATPYIWQNEQRTEIITPGTGRIRSYDLDGNLLYELGGG